MHIALYKNQKVQRNKRKKEIMASPTATILWILLCLSFHTSVCNTLSHMYAVSALVRFPEKTDGTLNHGSWGELDEGYIIKKDLALVPGGENAWSFFFLLFNVFLGQTFSTIVLLPFLPCTSGNFWHQWSPFTYACSSVLYVKNKIYFILKYLFFFLLLNVPKQYVYTRYSQFVSH